MTATCQIVEGNLMRVTANSTGDVQVRKVEFYLDGDRIVTDGNFPFEELPSADEHSGKRFVYVAGPRFGHRWQRHLQ